MGELLTDMQVHTTRSYAFSLAISPSKYLRSNHAMACCRTIVSR